MYKNNKSLENSSYKGIEKSFIKDIATIGDVIAVKKETVEGVLEKNKSVGNSKGKAKALTYDGILVHNEVKVQGNGLANFYIG